VDGSLSRSHGGLGIGLALVRTLVEMQGGRVTASSGGLGKGSEFAVKLPVLAGGTGHEMVTTLEPGERSGQALRVLVVEDNVDAGDSLSMLLRLHGHEVLVARTGPTALEVAASFHPALVLMDIGLPGMDGYEVARRMRSDPALAGVTLCALTGYTPSEADRYPDRETAIVRVSVAPPSGGTSRDEIARQLRKLFPRLHDLRWADTAAPDEVPTGFTPRAGFETTVRDYLTEKLAGDRDREAVLALAETFLRTAGES
jgi:CheY-like chemotaxis protein